MIDPSKKYPIVIIKWMDHSSCDTWISENDMEKYASLAECWSIGWLIKETEEAYVINAAFGDEGTPFGAIQTIGKGIGVEVKYVGKAFNRARVPKTRKTGDAG